MEMALNNGFSEMSDDEKLLTTGGVIPLVIAVAYVALFGVGFTAGITMGIKKWF